MKYLIKRTCLIASLLLCSHLWAIKLPDGTDAMIGRFEKHGNGKFKSVQLLEPIEIKTSIGTLTFNNTIYFYESGKIEKGELAKNFNIKTSFGNFDISRVSFYESGALMSFDCGSEQAKVKTILGDVNLARNYSSEDSVKMYESGSIKNIYIEDFVVPKECSYNNGMFALLKICDNLSFYENEGVESLCIPVYQGRKNAQTFNIPYGKLELKDIGYGSFLCKLKLYNDGKIEYIDLGMSENVLNTKNLGKIKVRNKVEFWNNENIKFASLAEEQAFEIGEELFLCNDISCFENGKVKAINEDATVFWENGNIKAKKGDYKEIETKVFSGIPKEFTDYFDFSIEQLFFDETGKKPIGVAISYRHENFYDESSLYFMIDENFKVISLAELEKDDFILRASKKNLNDILKTKM